MHLSEILSVHTPMAYHVSKILLSIKFADFSRRLLDIRTWNRHEFKGRDDTQIEMMS